MGPRLQRRRPLLTIVGSLIERPPPEDRERVMDALNGTEARGAIGTLTLQTSVPPPPGEAGPPPPTQSAPAPPPPSWMTKDDGQEQLTGPTPKQPVRVPATRDPTATEPRAPKVR